MRSGASDRPSDVAGIRLSDADRERLAMTLGRHYVDGRLDSEALSQRLEVVYRAQSREQAASVMADLPSLEPSVGARRRGRRHGEASAPEAGWLPTTERFRDPSTRRVMRVWVDPTDASRHYVAETHP